MFFEINGEKYLTVTSINNPQTNIDYLIYKKINTKELLVSRYSIVNNKPVLDPIENDEEYDFVDKKLSILLGEDNGNY